jgi:hypothetical protein
VIFLTLFRQKYITIEVSNSLSSTMSPYDQVGHGTKGKGKGKQQHFLVAA